MRGIPQGAASSSSSPFLQLFIRSGGLLVDPAAATYKIDDIHDPDAAVANVIPETSLNLITYALGTGRFVIPTGSTSDWDLGTYRLTCTYQLTAGGPTYTQTSLFEILDAADWAGTNDWTSYLSTRRIRQDVLVSADTPTTTLHRYLNRIARQIEGWCRRFFEPRYMVLRKSARESHILFLDEAIIAIESVENVWQTTDDDGALSEDTLAYDSYLFKVFNRHLDQGHDADDRYDPRLELISLENASLLRQSGGSYVWPYGSQNLRVKGVFGFTDPELDPLAGRTLIGQTPEDIAYVSGILLSRMVTDPTLSDPASARPGSILSYRTRHQSITFGSGSGGTSSGSSGAMSGDPLIDEILAKYGPPMTVTGV